MKKLIVNADDLGLSAGVTRGILEAHRKGIVTSTSAMMNAPDIIKSLALAKNETPGLGIGVHLVLTWGKPLLAPAALPGLVDDAGDFLNISTLTSRLEALNLKAVRTEWQTQIETFFTAGSRPDHLDSHHHCAYLGAGLFSVLLDLARVYNLPIRYPPNLGGQTALVAQMIEGKSVRSPKVCLTDFYGASANFENLEAIISALQDGCSELMCHPGIADRELQADSTYAAEREKELQVLTNPRAKALLKQSGVNLIRFSDL